jgi:hypothetical protein
MPRQSELIPEFVELAPPELKEGVLYVSMVYGSVIHKCCCGCGEKVVTPLGPTDWKLTFDGEAISLYPSIGNWSLPCQSHYWIEDNKVKWSGRMSRKDIESLRASERAERSRFHGGAQMEGIINVPRAAAREGFWSKVRAFLRLG